MKDLIKAYLKEISAITAQGDAREESYYPALKQFLESFPLEKGRKTQVTVLPKKTEAGSPDFRVWDGKDFIVGYIEAKTPGTNLDQIETSKQLQRYLSTFPNLILTDFYEFRLYRDGKLMQNATIARQFTAKVLKATPQVEQAEQFQALMEQFFGFKLPRSFTAESLAVELAKRTRFLADITVDPGCLPITDAGSPRRTAVLSLYNCGVDTSQNPVTRLMGSLPIHLACDSSAFYNRC